MKYKFVIFIILAVLFLLLFGNPNTVEPIFKNIFLTYKFNPVSIEFDQILSITFLGVVLFILSIIGRFEEHKINIGFINQYNKQINLLTQLSGITPLYFLYMVLVLLTIAYYKDPIVIGNLKSILFSIIMVTNCYILFLIVKSLIFEDIIDDLDIERHFRQYNFRISMTKLLERKI